MQFTHPTTRRRCRAVSLACLGVVLAGAQVASAASGIWIENAGGNWDTSTTTPWDGGIVAEGVGETADFSTVDITGNRTVTLTAPLTIGHLIFGDATTASHDWIVGGSALTLDVTSGAPTITVVNRSVRFNNALVGNEGLVKEGSGTLILAANNVNLTGTVTVNAGTLRLGSDSTTGSVVGDILLNNNSHLQLQRGATYTIAGNITGNGRLTVLNGSNNVTLAGDNTYSGGTTISTGALYLGTGTNFGIGTGTITMDGGRIGSADNDSRTITNALAFSNNKNVSFGGGNGAATGLGDLVFTDTSTGGTGANSSTNSMTVTNSTTVTLHKQFSGSAWINKSGSGTLILNGATMTYTGQTNVNAGTLIINGAKTGAGVVNVNDGGVLGGTGSINGDVTFAAGATFRPTSATDPLELLGSLTIDPTSILDLGWLSGLDAGTTYTLLTYGGSTLATEFSLINPVATHNVLYAANSIELVPVPEPTAGLALIGLGGLTMLRRRRT